jgi:IS5 family transposase
VAGGEAWCEVAPEMAKLHLAVDAASGMIVAQTLTDQDTDDASQVAPLLDQIDDPMGEVTADGAYDGAPTTRRSHSMAMPSRW